MEEEVHIPQVEDIVKEKKVEQLEEDSTDKNGEEERPLYESPFEEELDELDEEEPEQEEDLELKKLKEEVSRKQQEQQVRKFARVESKPEFASEIINAESNQKVANLKDFEITELLEKRKFVNLLVNFGWERLAKRVLDNIKDVENYSLSADGFLPKQVFTESSKSAQYTYEVNNKKKKREVNA